MFFFSVALMTVVFTMPVNSCDSDDSINIEINESAKHFYFAGLTSIMNGDEVIYNKYTGTVQYDVPVDFVVSVVKAGDEEPSSSFSFSSGEDGNFSVDLLKYSIFLDVGDSLVVESAYIDGEDVLDTLTSAGGSLTITVSKEGVETSKLSHVKNTLVIIH